MASKIKGQHMYLPITPYKLEGIQDEFNEISVYPDFNESGKHFYVSLKPGWGSGSWHGCCLYDGRGWLVDTTFIKIEDASRNSQKKLDEMYERLLQAKDIIVALFDHREWEKLKNAIINVCRVGYTDAFREQAEKFISENKATANNDNNDNLNNSETMATNAKGADLIGKVIVVNGGNVKYVIKSVDGDKLMTDFIMGDRTMPCPVPMSQVESMVEAGKWTIEGSEEPTATETKAEDVKPEPAATEETTADEPTATEEVEEVIDEPEPVKAATVKMQPKDKAEEKATKSKPQKPQTKAKSDTSHQHSALKYETYTTKRGKTGAKIVGFHETDAAYLAGPDLHGSATYERDKDGNKTFCLLFSHRYAEAAKEVCDALNAGKSVADCQAIIDGATEERAQRREEWRQKRAEREAQSNEGEATAKTEKLYTEAEVRKAFQTLADASGVDVKEFEPIIEAMRAAA